MLFAMHDLGVFIVCVGVCAAVFSCVFFSLLETSPG